MSGLVTCLLGESPEKLGGESFLSRFLPLLPRPFVHFCPVSLAYANMVFAALVQQGIEPNPGPCRHSKVRLLVRGFSVWSPNTGGAPKVWDFFKLVSSSNVSLAAVQEVRMKQNELDAFSSFAWHQGYEVFHVKGPDANTRADYERPTGGVMILVRRGIPHTECLHISQPGGEALAVWAGGLLLVGVYSPPNEHKADFLESLNSSLAEFSKCPFLFVGDWNLTPSENSFVDAFCASVIAAPAPGPSHSQPDPVYVLGTFNSMPNSVDSAASEPTMDLGTLEPHVLDAHPDIDDSAWLPTRWVRIAVLIMPSQTCLAIASMHV